jgi:hypothetical protein
MANVDWYRYDFVDSAGGFAPGQSRRVTFSEAAGGFQWFGKALSFSIMPFAASNQDRSITVTEYTHRSTGPSNSRLVHITYQNTGVNTITVYYIFLGIIRE